MRNYQNKLMALIMIMAALPFLSSTGFAQDVVALKPDTHKLLVDNDDVRVYEAIYKPGEKAPMHSHPKHIVYVLSGGKITMTGKDGKKVERTMAAGDVIENPPLIHATENTGDTEVKVLIVELKHSMDHKMMDKKKM
jgi:beta-alanine degradation protein BauB